MRKVLVAYDGSDLAKKALKEAMLQNREGEQVDVHIVTVVNPKGPYSNPGLYKSIERDLKEKAEMELEELLDMYQKDYPAAILTTEVLTGNPGNQIAEYAKEHQIDIITIGSRGLGSVKELFLGSVSHRVVQQADCKVMVVK
ncbi:universal stress protein [Pontibacillus salicampi]|uniref:Universal stress protein n=1 Tax=Pontibacillus salicampi TaxID=1449801 RepID=A0ABV6LQK7_9BACI